jgi:hypothetical protein
MRLCNFLRSFRDILDQSKSGGTVAAGKVEGLDEGDSIIKFCCCCFCSSIAASLICCSKLGLMSANLSSVPYPAR